MKPYILPRIHDKEGRKRTTQIINEHWNEPGKEFKGDMDGWHYRMKCADISIIEGYLPQMDEMARNRADKTLKALRKITI